MSISDIDHVMVTIPVGAEDEARAFYCDLLGLAEIPKPTTLQERGGLWLQVGERAVHLGVQDGVDRQGLRAHVAYAVTDLAHWRERLAAAHVPIKESTPIPGYNRFECRDPFGNRVEMIEAVIEER